MKMLKIILLILFCIAGFLCSQWAKSVYDKVHDPTTIECEDGICPMPEGWEDD